MRITRFRVVMLLAALTAVVSCTDSPTDQAPQTGDAAQTAGSVTAPREMARLVRAIDGDSIEAEVDGRVVEVRLIGLNAPERDECHGDAARDGLIELLDGADLTLQTPANDAVDQFGRALRYVAADGVDVNGAMIDAGHAVAVQSGHPREGGYLELAQAAALAGRGLWSATACGSPGGRSVTIAAVEYDPPGRDEENQLGEWVDIRNDGVTPLELEGWTLRDESTQNRYVFAAVTVEPGDRVRVRSGCGDDRGLDLVWCAGDAVWNNGGDTVILLDAFGAVAAYRFYEGAY